MWFKAKRKVEERAKNEALATVITNYNDILKRLITVEEDLVKFKGYVYKKQGLLQSEGVLSSDERKFLESTVEYQEMQGKVNKQQET